MKILHVISVTGMAGAEKLLLQLLPCLGKKADIECSVYCKQGQDSAALEITEQLKLKGITVHFCSYNKVVDKRILTDLETRINNGKYDIIHSHLKHSDSWLAWLKFKNRISVPVVSTMHGYSDEYENRFGFEIRRKLFFSPYFLITKWVYRQLDGFILISNIVSEFFNKVSLIRNKQQVMIYHGYEKTAFTPHISGKTNRNGEFKLALPGRLIKRKGHRYAIDALKKLSKSNPCMSLHIYGEGVEKKAIQKMVSDNGLADHVFFHGYVNDLLNKLKEMDMVLVPSLWEGFGLVFLDAFAAGIPVVAFDLPAANEIIKDGYNGLLSAPRSSDSLADNILRLYGDPGLRKKLATQAFDDLQARFSMNQMTDAYLEFYKRFI